jgi:hypothetical protein
VAPLGAVSHRFNVSNMGAGADGRGKPREPQLGDLLMKTERLVIALDGGDSGESQVCRERKKKGRIMKYL